MSVYQQKPTAEDIAFLFSDILGRPIPDEATRFYLDRQFTLRQLHETFTQSPEGRRNRLAALSRDGLHENLGRHIEWNATDAQLAKILAHIRSNWERLGHEDAYFSVLTDPAMRADRLDDGAIQLFHETGRSELETIKNFCTAAGITPDRRWRVAELGCGLGRITQYLADTFSEIVGIDISQSHLTKAREHLAALGRTNASFVHLQDYIATEDEIDLFVSFLVLQHNPPPAMAYLLRQFFNRIRKGGLAIFQVTTAIYDYEFRIAEYLRSLKARKGHIEMHALPQAAVFQIANECGMKPVLALPDGRGASGGISYTFAFQR